MRYISRYIIFTILLSALSSCALEEMLEPVLDESVCKEIEFVARPTNFVNSNVATKSESVPDFESAVYSAYFLVYDSNGLLIRYEKLPVANGKVTTQNMTMKTEKGLTGVTVCYIANLPESFVKTNMKATEEDLSADSEMTDLKKLQNTVIYFNGLNDLTERRFKINKASTGTVGVPNIDTDDTATSPSVDCIPMLGFWTGDLTGDGKNQVVEIQVKRLFSKVTFNIEFDLSDAYADDEQKETYTFSSIVVKNIPKQVTLFPNDDEYTWTDKDGNSKQLVYQSGTYFLSTNYNELSTSTITLKKKDKVTFTFYVPEYVVFPVNDDYKKKEWYQKEAERQYHKPTSDVIGRKSAPYVEFDGILSTKGQDFELGYKIFLGGNNYDDFRHNRNYHYNHNVLLNGISGGFGYDHRVDISYTGFLVGFQRATLLDSHFEVRPLRVKFDKKFIADNAAKPESQRNGKLTIKVLPGEDGKIPDWVRLERPNLDVTDKAYCLTGTSFTTHTKRKYFTEDLVTNTLKDNISITYNPFAEEDGRQPDSTGDIPIWVYIDEYSAQSAEQFSAESVRTATIEVSYKPNDGGDVISQEFIIKQRAIYPIQATSKLDGQTRTFGIEYFEEYLHSYDTNNDDDIYGVEGGEYYTSQNGVIWGFNNVQFSEIDRSLYYTSDGGVINIDQILQYVDLASDAKYDFYLTRDKDSEEDNIEVHDYEGYQFNMKIIESQNLKDISRTLAQSPQSAIEYCLNKNKRNKDGKVIYLYEKTYKSTADEITEIQYFRKRRALFYDYYKLTLTYDQADYTDTYMKTSNYKWYVPAVDELEDIVTNGVTHDFFSEVFVDNLYWTSQPAYDRNFSDVYWGSSMSHQYSSGAYMTDNTSAARATRYDVNSNTFISSDIIGDNPKEGYLKAKTFYGVILSHVLEYPGVDDTYVKNIELTNISGSEYSVGSNIKAVINYKKLDGSNMELPEGIQQRTSEHRVRCIYNPSPAADQLISSTSEYGEPTKVKLETKLNGRTLSPPNGWENGTTITTPSTEIPYYSRAEIVNL